MTFKQAWDEGSAYGKLMIIIGGLILAPLAVLPFFPEEIGYANDFLIPGLFSVILGFFISTKFQMKNYTAWKESRRFSAQVVTFAWLYGVLMGALPFFIAGELPFLRAIFESTSGWTSTGFTTIDVVTAPKIFLFHRSLMQYAGGVGFVMMVITILQGKYSMSLYDAEGHPDRLRPNIKSTVSTILIMYGGFLVFGTVLYMLVGVNFFDSLNHAMTALSTGGFSTKLSSIGEYNSLAVELVTILIMIIGTTNFGVLLLLFERKWKKAWRVSEIRFLIIFTIVLVGISTISLVQATDYGWAGSLRGSLFNVISAYSTAGLSTADYSTWPTVAFAVLTVAMISGGGIGSTSGGLKLTRIYIFLRVVWMNIKKRFIPKNQVQIESYCKVSGKQVIDDDLINDTFGYIGLYLFIYFFGSVIIALDSKVNFGYALFEFASTLSTVGLSSGITHASTPPLTLIVEIIGMIFGRLEVYVLLVGIHLTFEDLKQKWSVKK